MELERAKGTKDYPPEEKIIRQEIIDKLRNTFEVYGFSPLETPILERFDVLSAKYAGGAEILKETFKLVDQGNRQLGLRYDLTVPLARFIGMNPNLKMPFKRYQIGQVYRDGPIKTGRMREFWQCDVDVVGTKNMIADAECIKIAQRVFNELGLDVIIEINNRKILDGIMDSLNISEERKVDAITAIDKLKKIPVEEIKKELSGAGLSKEKTEELFGIINAINTTTKGTSNTKGRDNIKGTNAAKIERLKKILKAGAALEGLKEIEDALSYVDENKKNAKVVFSVSLARGLSYYTSTVFEVFMADGSFKSSLAGGGRWDKMIGEFLSAGSATGQNKEYPAVGISFGIEPITVVLNEQKRLKKIAVKKTVTEVYVIPIPFDKSAKPAAKIVEELREDGIKADMDISGRGISKNMDFANSYGIPYVLFIGEEELKKKKYKLKDMNSGKEEFLDVKGIVKRIKC